MPAAYDSYNYPQYWENREYEHKSETIAISEFLAKIPKLKTILDIGAGFGRITPTYLHRAPKIILSDPSAKLLKIARKKLNTKTSDGKGKKLKFIQIKLENLPEKIRKESVDLIVFVRVLHHIEDVDKAFAIINQLISQKGYLILEFANKRHLKAIANQFIRGNITYLLDIFPKELNIRKSKIKKLPFLNYHPDAIHEKLLKHGFKIIEVRSVSNIRSPYLKRFIPLELLLNIEKHIQKAFAKICFGPSIFILAKKN